MNRVIDQSARKRQEISQIINSIRLIRSINQRSTHALTKDFRITGQQLGALRIVAQTPRISLGELSDRMYLHISTGCGIVDRLEKKGFLTRERSREDRRVVHLKITVSGKEIVDKAPVSGFGMLIQDIGKLPSGEVHQVLGAMKILMKVMKIESSGSVEADGRTPLKNGKKGKQKTPVL